MPRPGAPRTERRDPKRHEAGDCGGGGGGCSASALLGFAIVAGGLYYLSRIPLPSPAPLKQTTFVYDSTGKHVLASFSEQNRVNVSIKQVPQVVINAVVSTEDRHFFTEGALNPVSIVRAFISDVRGTGTLQGASTITQQYVKQTYLIARSARSAARSRRRPWPSGWRAQSPNRRSCRTISTPSTGAEAPTAWRLHPRPTLARTSASWACPRLRCWPA